MSENKINVSLKKCCICNNSKIGEFTIINDNKYHLCCIEELQQQLKDKDEKISKAIEYCNEKLKWNRDDGNDYWAGKNNAQQQVSSDIKDILESNKEE